MLIELVEEDGKIVFKAAKGGCSEVSAELIDNVIEETALAEIYEDVEDDILAPEYEMYKGSEETIVGEMAVLLNELVMNLKLNGYKIVKE